MAADGRGIQIVRRRAGLRAAPELRGADEPQARAHAFSRDGAARAEAERQQMLLGRLVDIGTELFAITATSSRAQSLHERAATAEEKDELARLADYFFRSARLRIEQSFRGVHDNTDRAGHRLGQEVLAGRHAALEEGMVERGKER